MRTARIAGAASAIAQRSASAPEHFERIIPEAASIVHDALEGAA
jgi:hypothetical protein